MSDDQPAAPRPGDPSPSAFPAYGGWAGSPDVLAAEAPERSPRRAPWALVGGIALLVLALVGGVTYAVGALSGGGSQPDDALPTGAFAYASIDLDPPAAQKIDAFRFLRTFPALRGRVPADGDARKVFFDAFAQDAGWSGVDYDSQVEPWLGKRLGVAVYPPTGSSATPLVVLALQVTDQDAADAGLRRLADASGPAAGSQWAFSGDYALLTDAPGVVADLAKRAGSSPLSGDATFSSDLAAVADDGIATAWVDMSAAFRAAATSGLGSGVDLGVLSWVSGQAGRSTVVARFDGSDTFEVVGRATGVGTGGWATHPVQGMDTLPASTVAALGISDGDKLVPKAWESMRKALGDEAGQLDQSAALLRSEFGIAIPDDIATLLGSNALLAVDSGQGSSRIQGGARISTDISGAQAVLDKLEAAAQSSGGDVPVVRREAGGDLIVASTQGEASRLAAAGDLGSNADFRDALPDLASADVAIWVDPATLVTSLFGGSDVDENLSHVKGVGITVSSDHSGTATYRFRLVAR
jgi:hypothetical protein